MCMLTQRQSNGISYANDPTFDDVAQEEWRANWRMTCFPSRLPNKLTLSTAGTRPISNNESRQSDFKNTCDEWLNFSTFLARCVGEGIHGKQLHHSLRWAARDIPSGLKDDLPDPVAHECFLMVSVQWILHAGRCIHDDMVRTDEEGWNLDTWKSWATRLNVLHEGGMQNGILASKIRGAITEMESIDTATSIFPHS